MESKTFRFFGRVITIIVAISAAITKTIEIDLDKIKKAGKPDKFVEIAPLDVIMQWKDKLITALKARQEACRNLLVENAENIQECLVCPETIPYANKKNVLRFFNIKSYDAMEDMILLLEKNPSDLIDLYFSVQEDYETNVLAYHMARQASKAIAWLPFEERKNEGTVSYEMLASYLDTIKEQKLLRIR